MKNLNREWHRAHRMPEKATRGERVAWHAEHLVECGCRPVPQALAAEVRDAVRGRPLGSRPS